MAKGWKQHRLEANGQWQYTGQLTDQVPPYEGPPITAGRSLLDGIDTLGKTVRVWIDPTTVDPLPVGTLGWVQFTSAPEPRLPPGTPTSDYIPPGRD